jgi:hypothetical protein
LVASQTVAEKSSFSLIAESASRSEICDSSTTTLPLLGTISKQVCVLRKLETASSDGTKLNQLVHVARAAPLLGVRQRADGLLQQLAAQHRRAEIERELTRGTAESQRPY